MKAGDTFYLSNRGVDSHLWVVVSDPEKDAERVILVSMTTYEDHEEDVCLIDVGEHARVSHKTCIAYNEARMTTLEKLNALLDSGNLAVQPAASNELLARIRDGVSRSARIKYKLVEILLEQGVIE